MKLGDRDDKLESSGIGSGSRALGIVLVFFKLTSLFSSTAKVENCHLGL